LLESESFTGIFEAINPSDLAQPPQHFALLTYPPLEVATFMDDIRRRYDPAFKEGIAPHITIKRPAILPDTSLLPVVSAALKTAMARLVPSPVDLDGYNIFRKPGRNVVFLKIRDEQPFCQLHHTILKALGEVLPEGGADQFEGEAYHPHLTIGNALDDLELAVLEHELSSGQYRLNFSFELAEIVLLHQPPRQPWQRHETFRFGLK